MPEPNAALHDRLRAAWADIVDRLNAATDPAEIATLTAARDRLRIQVDLATQGQLDDTAGAVADAIAALVKAHASAASAGVPYQPSNDEVYAYLSTHGAKYAKQ